VIFTEERRNSFGHSAVVLMSLIVEQDVDGWNDEGAIDEGTEGAASRVSIFSEGKKHSDNLSGAYSLAQVALRLYIGVNKSRPYKQRNSLKQTL